MKSSSYFGLLIILFACIACESDKKTPKIADEFTIQSDQLSCDEIVVRNHTGVVEQSEFAYGEKITLYFQNMKGFELKEGLAYPNMDIFVTNKKGDTILQQKGLFDERSEGLKQSELTLQSKLTLAKPMLANNSYDMHVHITDKHSDAFYSVKRNFSVVHNDIFSTETEGITYTILYLFSQDREVAVLDRKIAINEKLYLLIEGLDGFEVDADGLVDIKASIRLEKADGTVINEIDNLFANPVSAKDLKDQLYASIVLTDATIKKPVTGYFEIQDNRSDRFIKTEFPLTIE